MAVEIYVDRGQPFQESTVELDGTEYQLSVRYSQREDRYYLSLRSIEGAAITLGNKIVLRWPLLRGAPVGGPPGQIIALSNESRDQSPPGLGELGSKAEGARVQLVYFEQAELEDAGYTR